MTPKNETARVGMAPRPWETSYNGWTWSQRCAVTPIQNRALRDGLIERPTSCCICGYSRPSDLRGRGYIFLHLERYDCPLDFYPCCKRCHAALHARFRDPDRWQRVLRRHGAPGRWFTVLSLDPASQWRPFRETYAEKLPSPFSEITQPTLL